MQNFLEPHKRVCNLVDFILEQTGEVTTDEVAKDYDYIAREVLGAQSGRSHHHVEGIGYRVVEAKKDKERNAEENEQELFRYLVKGEQEFGSKTANDFAKRIEYINSKLFMDVA